MKAPHTSKIKQNPLLMTIKNMIIKIIGLLDKPNTKNKCAKE
jgi:hypothetical protein